jgi:glycine betaine/choline ABC-type transport system substrate-binding protein
MKTIWKLKVIALVLYEIIFVCLWIAAIIPRGITFLEFWRSPFKFMKIDEISIALTLALFMPLIFKDVAKFKLFGAEVEMHHEFEHVRSEIKQVKRNLAEQRYDYDRALFSIIAGVSQQLRTKGGREDQDLCKAPLKIGAMDFAESWIMQQVVYQKMLKNGTPVAKPGLGETTLMTFFNLIEGKIDCFIWYSGSGMAMAGLDIVPHDEEHGLDILNTYYNRLGLQWLNSLGFESVEGPVMLKEKADQLNIKTMGQLADQAHLLTFGANREYFLRHWAYPRLKARGMSFKKTEEVSINDRLSGLFAGDFDVGIGYSTDPESNDRRLFFPENDRRFPPIPQYCMPVCRQEVASEIEKGIGNLIVSPEIIRKMLIKTRKNNYSKYAIQGVAKDFVDDKLK